MSYSRFHLPSLRRLRCLGIDLHDARDLYREMQRCENHFDIYRVLEYASNILNGYGVQIVTEAMFRNSFYGYIGLLYAGRGDLYELLPTILFDPEENSFAIDSPTEYRRKFPARFGTPTNEGREEGIEYVEYAEEYENDENSHYAENCP